MFGDELLLLYDSPFSNLFVFCYPLQLLQLEQMGFGDENTRLNPMAQHGAASAFSDNQALKNKAGKVIGGGDLAANFKTNAAEEKVDSDSVAVYRVEFSTTKKKMNLVEQDEKEFGSFFDGDSYVVVSTRIPRPTGPSKVTRDIFVWKSLEKQKTMGDVNDVLEQMGFGDENTRLNPMAQHGAASAFSDNQALKNKAGKVIGGGDLAANFKTNAVEDKVDSDSVAVYRVEFSTTKKKMNLVEQDEKEFGSFFDGDSYVVVSTRIPRPTGPSKVTRDIFVWIGQVSTPDEIRAAVSEAVGLDCTFSSDFLFLRCFPPVF
ncbi:Hypothetical protein, putative [Bodo saltans]|uniref:Gelsolin-like domain-containing protein n=1 Tax=Bodo saltans TaxID=75058 RepID=A0A0S4KG34_BODSA|nr:Hypothetical protein, putative [Bodo saltans]|eukprot:CUI14631.1 Hypothetical protein, putative [Bodo saltans]